MKEKNPHHNERTCGPGGGGSIFDEFEDSSNMATVSSGVYEDQLPVANSTVAEVRARHRDRPRYIAGERRLSRWRGGQRGYRDQTESETVLSNPLRNQRGDIPVVLSL